MPKIIFLYSVFLLASYYAKAQECTMYIPFEKGFSSQSQEYDKKGKPLSKTTLTVVDVQSTANGKIATIEMKSVSLKDEVRESGTRYTVWCNNGTTKIDTRAALSGPVSPDISEERGSCFTELSADIQVGQTFDDCLFSHKQKKAYFETKIFNRKVTGKETVTVPAGTFEAFVVEYDMSTIMRQGMEVIFTYHHRDWYAPGKGLVRTESFQPGHRKSNYKPGDSPLTYTELIVVK